MPKKQDYTLKSVNDRLNAAHVKAKIVQRGSMLWVQATLPPKPGSDRPMSYQQKISLGVPASEEGFKRAEQEARLIGAELASKNFDQRKYLKPEQLPEGKPVAKWVAEFKAQYMETHDLTEQTWAYDWERIYGRLPQDKPLTDLAMMAAINGTDRNTRIRMEVCRQLLKLADFAKIDVDLLQYKGNYGASQVEDRDLPTDEAIAQWRHKIPNPEWRWAYGVMAAYGLRDHEVFFAKWTDDGLLITQGKTGQRLVFEALYPEWVDEWDLRTIRCPKVRDVQTSYARGKLGDKVARQFRRYGVPFPPYDLRHCYGIRASVTFDFPVTVSAKLMGHSPAVHLKRYHRHITLKQSQDAAQRIMQRPDRPSAPTVKPIDA